MTRFIVGKDENTYRVTLDESEPEDKEGVYLSIDDIPIMLISNEGYIELLPLYDEEDIGLEKETVKDEQFAVVYYPDAE